MIRHRTKKEVRRFDLYKITVAVILLLAVVIFPLIFTVDLFGTDDQQRDDTQTATEIVDVAPTSAPRLDSISPSISDPVAGATVNVGTIPLSGQGVPGSKVRVLVNDAEIGTTIVTSDGSWALETTLPEMGDYELQVQTLDASDNVAIASAPVTISWAEPVEP